MKMGTTSLKVLTLNCWGVFTPVACQLRHERMLAIAKELSKGEYDIVLLQEVWTQSDYGIICAKVLSLMSYTHYFHSGMFGSGLCVFSKYPILETQTVPYVLNGYPTKIHHGDWFCGKAVGFAKLLVNGIKLNLYVTHLHAEYDKAHDVYEAHRVAQAFQISQFIHNTSEACDVVLVGGDLNCRPDSNGYKLVRYVGNLQDSWLTQSAPCDEECDATCDRPDNSFTSKTSLAEHPHGQRLDYLLYRHNAGYSMTCESCALTMGKIPGEDYNFSDHEGVSAVYTIKKNVTGMGLPCEPAEIEKHLGDLLPVIDGGVKKAKSDQVFYGVTLLLSLLALVSAGSLLDGDCLLLQAALGCLRFVFTVTMAASFWMALVTCNREINGLTATRNDVNNRLKSNPIM